MIATFFLAMTKVNTLPRLTPKVLVDMITVAY